MAKQSPPSESNEDVEDGSEDGDNESNGRIMGYVASSRAGK